jgi:hypothetical protein
MKKACCEAPPFVTTNILKQAAKVKSAIALVMYESVCKFGLGRGMGKNGFHIWPRKGDLEVVEGRA